VHTHAHVFENSLDLRRVGRLRQVIVESGIGGALPIALRATRKFDGGDFDLFTRR
jgi:hypothetical protein